MNKIVKKIIAREGLIILATLILGSFLILLYPILKPDLISGMMGQAVVEYDMLVANRVLISGIILVSLYPLYLLIRFIIWAIKTLREK